MGVDVFLCAACARADACVCAKILIFANCFLVAVLLLGASDAKRTLRGNARPSVDNRDAVMMIIIILNVMMMR